MAGQALERLRYPRTVVRDVTRMVANHMRFMDVPRMKRATLRRLVAATTFPRELELHRLDCLCSHQDLSNVEFLRRFMQALEEEPALPEPWVDGHDLMRLGLEEGPRIGFWLKKAYEAQLEGRFETRDELLTWLADALDVSPD
jgi:poly(A) polymerase